MANARIVRDAPTYWSGMRDAEGYREYKIKWLVEMLPKYKISPPTEIEFPASYYGPATALQVPGLPLPGSYWNFGQDVDIWVWCRPNAIVQPVQRTDGDAVEHFTIEQTFSNRPTNSRRCQDEQIEDPLLEPAKVSGTFVNEKEEGILDRFGIPIRTSSHEQIRGPQNEWDSGSDTIKIEMNIPSLDLGFLASFKNTLNDATLWGCPTRWIKLSKYTQEKIYHSQCEYYYKVVLDFDIKYGGWDRDLLDEGTKVLKGHWDTTGHWQTDLIGGLPPDPENPAHFIRFKDPHGENCRVVLNGAGLPIERSAGTGTGADEPGFRHVERYHNANFLLLGIPLAI